MAVIDQLKRMMGRQQPDAGPSQSAPDVSMYQMEAELKSSQTQYGPPEVLAQMGIAAADHPDQIALPFMGKKTVAQHRWFLSTVLIGSLLALVAVTMVGLNQSAQAARQLNTTGQAMMQSQRLAKSVTQALVGDAGAFAEVSQSSQILARVVHGLMDGDAEMSLAAVGEADRQILDKAEPLADRAEKNAAIVLAQKPALTQVASTLQLLQKQSAGLLNLAESVLSFKLDRGAPAAELSAASAIAMLTQRIGKTAAEFLSIGATSPQALDTLTRDLETFKQLTSGLLDGKQALGLAAVGDAPTREKLQALMKLHDETVTPAGTIKVQLQGLLAARAAQASILADSELLRTNLEALQSSLSGQTALSAGVMVTLALLGLLTLLSAAAFSYLQLLDSRQRQINAEVQKTEAQTQEQEAKRVNDANQAAILRLMNELQLVAEGDLTQQATVTEDITGAIADSVNYTVEELRSLVGNVQDTAAKVAQTTADVDVTSTELLAASNEQLHEIGETGRSVVDMAGRINQVSNQAQESADVARQSLQAAAVGLLAVQNAIGGMNTIRDQIQDTSKRIKRLGESSQEIGEITELISDITEQTNVLALNAAIQAASAGEAGRGFSVVAEEVQRLAERSADATRQIAALVKAIQTDTHDAVGAMERSTHGVVEGAKLSDNAGAALSQIDQVSRHLAELIEHISASTLQEANLANELAGNIQHIFAVTEQTGEGTRATAAQVRELSKMAEELRQSVARFRIA
ncbi:MAG: type IV pili methyl-accepting chemotaxis transducer N-terminal domain-containing protein [Rhodoferax sp.]|jgi:twitching motility protein PilJ|nr:type IV pili methyl-accepting chemotaxis transducer N-terminal domain-containing protein [Rhodoferax sp.]